MRGNTGPSSLTMAGIGSLWRDLGLAYTPARCDSPAAMKRLTEAWESALPPAWLSAIRRRFGHGVPSPSSTTTLAGLAASDQPPGGCDVIQLGGCPRLPLPGFSVSGDFVAVEAVRSRIGNRLALEQYDRLVAGPVVQPQVDSFVAVLAEARVCQSAGLVITAENALLADVSDLAFVADDPAGPLGVSHLPRPRHTPLTVAVLTTGPHHNYYHQPHYFQSRLR